MTGPCSADFERLAAELGDFGCEGANAFLNLKSPFSLDHWTLLIIEAATVIGLVLAFRHALRRRREGDPTGLAIWIAAIAYLAFVEPPLYFPHQFGLEEQVGLIFVHNEFTVQFLWKRLPLYILSFYPVLAFLSYELVRVIGVFERRGPFTSALAVGFVYHVFYEIFDHIGPQLWWWIWNLEAPTNEPFLASVPISSMVTFAVAGPVALTFLIRTLVARRAARSTEPMTIGALIGWSTLVGLLMPLGLVIGGLPATIFSFGDEPNHTAQAIAMWLTLAAVGAVALYVIRDAWLANRAGEGPTPSVSAASRRYVATHAGIYLGALMISWVAALPAYFDATGGITADGTPIGSLPYAIGCTIFAVGFVTLGLKGRSAEPTDQPGVEPDSQPALV